MEAAAVICNECSLPREIMTQVDVMDFSAARSFRKGREREARRGTEGSEERGLRGRWRRTAERGGRTRREAAVAGVRNLANFWLQNSIRCLRH